MYSVAVTRTATVKYPCNGDFFQRNVRWRSRLSRNFFRAITLNFLCVSHLLACFVPLSLTNWMFQWYRESERIILEPTRFVCFQSSPRQPTHLSCFRKTEFWSARNKCKKWIIIDYLQKLPKYDTFEYFVPTILFTIKSLETTEVCVLCLLSIHNE